VKQPSREILDVLFSLIIGLGKFVVKGHEHGLQYEDADGLCFVNSIVSGVKVETLLNSSENHNFVSE
jgi:hypothetical protein